MDTEVRLLGVPLSTLARRRTLVLSLYASYGLILIPFWLAHHGSKLLLAFALPAFLLWAACFWALSQIVRSYAYPSQAGAPDPADERQAQVRDRSFTRSYWLLSGVVSLGVLYAIIARDFHWPIPQDGALQAVLFGLLLLSATLPSSVIVWTERDDPEDRLQNLAPHLS